MLFFYKKLNFHMLSPPDNNWQAFQCNNFLLVNLKPFRHLRWWTLSLLDDHRCFTLRLRSISNSAILLRGSELRWQIFVNNMIVPRRTFEIWLFWLLRHIVESPETRSILLKKNWEKFDRKWRTNRWNWIISRANFALSMPHWTLCTDVYICFLICL